MDKARLGRNYQDKVPNMILIYSNLRIVKLDQYAWAIEQYGYKKGVGLSKDGMKNRKNKSGMCPEENPKWRVIGYYSSLQQCLINLFTRNTELLIEPTEYQDLKTLIESIKRIGLEMEILTKDLGSKFSKSLKDFQIESSLEKS